MFVLRMLKKYHSIKNILAALFYEQISHFKEVEVQTRFADGYAYGKHLIALHQGYYPLHFPIIQVGRFIGNLPLEVTVLGKVRLNKTIDTLNISDTDVIPGNESLMTAWYGDHIHELLRKPQTNITVQEITDISIEQKILTPYTGMLVFRPGDNHGYEPDNEFGEEENQWDNPPTDVDSEEVDSRGNFSPKIQAYPNPFNAKVTIQIAIPELTQNARIKVAIFNTLGQKVKTFDLNNGINYNELNLSWNGTMDSGEAVSSGVYFIVVQFMDMKKMFKIMLVQ